LFVDEIEDENDEIVVDNVWVPNDNNDDVIDKIVEIEELEVVPGQDLRVEVKR
jgi:hypothetical protein